MKPMNALAKEFELKYEGTVVHVKSHVDDSEGLCSVSNSEDYGWPFLSLGCKVLLKGKKLSVQGHKPLYDLKITRFLPPEGYYNTRDGAFWLKRLSTKQWKNSYCQAIYGGRKLLLDAPEVKKALSVGYNGVISAITATKYYTTTAAYKRVVSGKNGCALNRHICVELLEKGEDPMVLFNEYPIGRLLEPKAEKGKNRKKSLILFNKMDSFSRYISSRYNLPSIED